MQDLKDRREKLLAEATDCELIGNLATDDAKRATFRRLAQQFRTIAEQLKADMDQGGMTTAQAVRLAHLRAMPDDAFLRQQATTCRELAACTTDKNIQAELQRLANEFEEKARTR